MQREQTNEINSTLCVTQIHLILENALRGRR